MIWTTQVILGLLKPPTGTCLHVLSTAARVGNVKLATDVLRVLVERDIILQSHHYEALVECYLNAGDLPSALSAVIIMQESGLRIDPEALHPLHTYLVKDISRPTEAFRILQELSSGEGKKVPVVLVNACIQGCFIPGSTHEGLTTPVEIHKALQTLCISAAHWDAAKQNALLPPAYTSFLAEHLCVISSE